MPRLIPLAIVYCATAGSIWAAETARPPLAALHPPPGGTMEQVSLGDRIFHGEVADGHCSTCHGIDAKGSGNGNDLTLGMWVWGDGSTAMLKNHIVNSLTIAPGMGGDLTPSDTGYVDAVTAYVWSLGHQKR